jgi:hypothetical protein
MTTTPGARASPLGMQSTASCPLVGIFTRSVIG